MGPKPIGPGGPLPACQPRPFVHRRSNRSLLPALASSQVPDTWRWMPTDRHARTSKVGKGRPGPRSPQTRRALLGQKGPSVPIGPLGPERALPSLDPSVCATCKRHCARLPERLPPRLPRHEAPGFPKGTESDRASHRAVSVIHRGCIADSDTLPSCTPTASCS